MISVVTVNYKTADYLEKMLTSLFEHNKSCDYEVFIVENGSGDDLKKLEEKFPKAKFIYSEKNLGFAGGCNLAIEQAKGEYIVLVNPDIIFDSDALCAIEQKMEQESEVGIGGISLKNLDGTQQPCVWKFPTPKDQLLLLLKVPHVFPRAKSISKWLMKNFDYERDADVDQVMGAFFCIRKQVIDRIGLLDDGFFIWYEEVDYCKRAKDSGWKIRYYADISAKHKKGSSFDRVETIKKQAVLRKSLRRYMRKHHGWRAWLLFTLPEPLFIALAFVASVIKPK